MPKPEPLSWWQVRGMTPEQEIAMRKQDIKDGNVKAAVKWSGRLPICPYGCDREGTLLEVVMGEDGNAYGIFNDHPCNCIFVAEIQVPEPPKAMKMVIGPDGEYHEVQA